MTQHQHMTITDADRARIIDRATRRYCWLQPADRDDLHQLASIGLLLAERSLAGACELDQPVAWLLTAVRRYIADHMHEVTGRNRHQYRKVHVELVELHEDDLLAGTDLEAEAIARQQLERVGARIERLTAHERAMVLGHGVHGLTVADAARQAGLSRCGASRILARALVRLAP